MDFLDYYGDDVVYKKNMTKFVPEKFQVRSFFFRKWKKIRYQP